MNLSKDEIFLISMKLDIKSLLNFCLVNKRVRYCDDIWSYKLDSLFPDHFKFKNIKKIDLYFLYPKLVNLKMTLGLKQSLHEIMN